MIINTKTRDYSKGKIYKIECLNGDADDIYIGSTTKQFLSQRMTKHREDYRIWLNHDKSINLLPYRIKYLTSYKVFEKYGIENCIITLLESVNVNTLDELKAREAYYIKTMNCVNKVIPLRTKAEYRTDTKEQKREVDKLYYESNKEEIKKYKKQWGKNNYINNNEKYKTKNECVCGSTYCYPNKSRHMKSVKHLDYIKLQETVIL